MSDPFFNYIRDNSRTISQALYGPQSRPKRYERLESIKLPYEKIEAGYAETLRSRKTTRHFSPGSLTLSSLGTALYWSVAHHADAESAYGFLFPSGGGKYPMETYVLVRDVAGLDSGAYHYDPYTHSVTKLPSTKTITDEMVSALFFGKTEFKGSPNAVVVCTMVKERVIQTYGARAYYLALVEAGHRGQLVYQSAAAAAMAACACGRVDHDAVHELLAVDGVNEHHVYSVMLGLPAQETDSQERKEMAE